MAAVVNLDFYGGEGPLITFTMNPVVNITGWTITFYALDAVGGNVLFTVACTVTNGAGGVYTAQLTHAQTVDLAPMIGAYYTERSENDYPVLSTGQLIVRPR